MVLCRKQLVFFRYQNCVIKYRCAVWLIQNDLVYVVADGIRDAPGISKFRVTFKLEHKGICTVKILGKQE